LDLIKKYFPCLSLHQLEQFAALGPLYEEWNTKINVISRKDMHHFYEHHVLHSLSIASKFSFPENYHVMDLGSGGGFPGIPLAIFFPQVYFHMVDSVGKKLQVVNDISAKIELKNTSTQHTRAEDINGEKFNMIISRAVAPLKDLWEWSFPLLEKSLKKDDKNYTQQGLICLKGGDLKMEIAQSGRHPQVWEIYQLFKEDYFKDKYILFVRQTS
jgi:16S rRNA (guanine527-N7)-methyltransferase